jgi:hypothetical protein
MQIRQEEENYTESHNLHDTLRHLSDFHKFYLNFTLQKDGQKEYWRRKLLLRKNGVTDFLLKANAIMEFDAMISHKPTRTFQRRPQL